MSRTSTPTIFAENGAPCGRLFLAAHTAASTHSLRAALMQASLAVEEPFCGILAVPLSGQRWQALEDALVSGLSEGDRRRARCRLMPPGVTPAPAELMQTESLCDFLDFVAGQWLGDLLAQNRLVTYFQPIVNCREPSQIFAYECLTRGEDPSGEVIPPTRLYAAARATGKLTELDLASRLKAVKSAAARNLTTNVFVNFNPRSIADPVECVESVVQAVLESGLDPAQFVFEVVESDEIVDPSQLLSILDHYREAGFRVALDDLGAGYSSLNLMADVKPDFVKLDMGLIHNVDRDVYKAQVAAKLLELAHDLGVYTVVEGVETRAQWEWSRDHKANFAQGFFFARPSPEPPPVNVPAVASGDFGLSLDASWATT